MFNLVLHLNSQLYCQLPERHDVDDKNHINNLDMYQVCELQTYSQFPRLSPLKKYHQNIISLHNKIQTITAAYYHY